jgi:predicted nucleic acid-binding protein
LTDGFYSFDTSAILNGRRDLFRPTVFHTLWAQIEDAITAGQVRSADEVQRELARRDDDAKQWADAQSDLFVPLELPIQQSAAQILAVHSRLVGQGGRRSAADPFVIALAMVRNGTVVTEETARGNLTSPRIPDVCGDLGVPCVTLMEFIEAQGWTF